MQAGTIVRYGWPSAGPQRFTGRLIAEHEDKYIINSCITKMDAHVPKDPEFGFIEEVDPVTDYRGWVLEIFKDGFIPSKPWRCRIMDPEGRKMDSFGHRTCREIFDIYEETGIRIIRNKLLDR